MDQYYKHTKKRVETVLEACRHHVDVDFSYTYISLSRRCTLYTFFGQTDGLIMPDHISLHANKKTELVELE